MAVAAGRRGGTSRAIFLLIVLAGCLAMIGWGPRIDAQEPLEDVSLAVELDREAVALDEAVELIVEVSWTGSAQRFLFGEPELGASETFHQAGGAAAANVRWEESGQLHSKKTWRFRLKPLLEGDLKVPPVTVTYQPRDGEGQGWGGERILMTPSMSLKVTPSDASSSGASAGLMLPVVLAVAAACLGVAAWWSIRRRGGGEAEAPPLRSPWIELRERRSELEALAVRGERKKYVTAMDALMRQAFELGLGVGSSGLEGSEALRRISEKSERRSLLDPAAVMFELADLVKFAGHQPEPMELDRVRAAVLEILDHFDKEGAGDGSRHPSH